MENNNKQEETPSESLFAIDLQDEISIKEDEKPKGKKEISIWKKELNALMSKYNKKFKKIYKLVQ